MKRILLLVFVLVFLLSSCMTDAFAPEQTTPAVTTPAQTTPTETTPTETIPQETTPTQTTPEETESTETTPAETMPHEHLFGEEVVTQSPTCVQNGTKVAYCSCGASEETEMLATGKHDYVNNVCTWCQKEELNLIPSTSNYDVDADGEKDIYYFSPQMAERCENGIWLWAGDYDTKLSGEVQSAKVANIKHWYVQDDPAQRLTYRISVPENGIYEMVLHMRLKDGKERGAKYTFNEGTAIEQVFETSHAFDEADLSRAQSDTIGTYMYGIRVYLQGGENIFSITTASQTPNSQHFREFYFVKVGEAHIHNFQTTQVIKEPTCHTTGEKIITCECGKTQTVTALATGAHTFQNGVCSLCGEVDIPFYAIDSVYDANGDGAKDTYYFSPEQSTASKAGIHIWAGDYDKNLSTSVNKAIFEGVAHWYVTTDGSEHLVYRVEVPEDGIYEMTLHMRLKDTDERGAKYIINEGTDHEQIFETSHTFDALTLEQARNETVGTYMYGIRVNLVAGENIIKITAASSGSKAQHFRDFYFVKVGELHNHNYAYRTVTAEPNCLRDGEVIFSCTCGAYRSAVLPALPAHTYVDEICIFCGREQGVFGFIDYEFLSDKPGFAGGTITIIPESAGIYALYWADENGKLPSYTMVGYFTAHTEQEIHYSIHEYTAIPKGATRLIAVCSNGEQYTYSFDIPAERQFVAEELYLFGALSDTHQGTRYGPESQSVDRLVKAGEILSQKGAVLVGINGDIANANTEREYYLHGEAIKAIYAINPTMPIYTVSGNHEAKYTGFSREWYDMYARNIVEYQTDFPAIYTEDNDLDYVVELPDGSVIIFLHQVYYDYGKAESRLMDDYQLDWLGDRLEQYKDRTVFLFFHTEMEGKVGHFSNTTLVMKQRTEDYKRLNAYFEQYTNVIFFSGHSHNSFQVVFDETLFDRIINSYEGKYATLVHIPSLSDNIADGHIVHVYEDYIVFEGYDFENEQTFAYGTFIIER